MRRSDIDFLRIVAAIFIMIYHSYYYLDLTNHYFAGGWVFVEFFFLLTGYYTAKHFDKLEEVNTSLNEKAVISVKYTYQRLKKIIVPFFIVLFIEYFIVGILKVALETNGVRSFFGSFITLPGEALLLSATGLISAHVGASWYLSAMILVLPIISFLLLFGKKITKLIIAPTTAVLFYSIRGFNNRLEYGGDDLLRAFACILLGCFLYEICKLIKNRIMINENKNKVAIATISTVVQVALLLMILYLIKGDQVLFPNRGTTFVFIFLLLVITLSDLTWSKYLSFNYSVLFADASLLIYLLQRPVSNFINLFSFSNNSKQILYYSITIVLSFLISILIIFIKKSIENRKHRIA